MWQKDVTKYPPFGKYKNIQLSVDTFSNAVFASVHTGETANHVCQYFWQAFASLGVPQEIKTDNGPAYTAQKVATFLMNWGVCHTFGIPYSSTSQAIVERTHHSLKCILDQQKGDVAQATPQMRLSKALYIYNFLNSSSTEPDPPIFRHFSNSTHAKLKENPLVLIRNPETGQIKGPFRLITWGKGFACVSTGTGPRQFPAKNMKPHHTQKNVDNPTSREESTQT